MTLHEIERHAATLEAAATLLRRLDEDGIGADGGAQYARTMLAVLARTSEVEWWSRREIREILDEMEDQGVGVPRRPE
jgi:hypothetical protein